MKILECRKDQAKDVISLLKAVATNEGNLPLHAIHYEALSCIAKHLLNTEVDIDSLAYKFTDMEENLPAEMIEDTIFLASTLPFLEKEGKEDRALALERLSEKFHQSKKFVHDILNIAQKHMALVTLHTIKNGEIETGRSLANQIWLGLLGEFHLDGNKKTLEEYQAYRKLAEGTFGREMVRYYDENEFPLPGSSGAIFSNLLMMHDKHHVLTGYDTSPLGEICVAAFDNAVSGGKMNINLALLVAQFQIGMTVDPSITTWVHQFDAESVFTSLSRAENIKINYMVKNFDFKPYMPQPLEDVRAQLGISPQGMLVKGKHDLWCSPLGPPGKRTSKDIANNPSLKLQ